MGRAMKSNCSITICYIDGNWKLKIQCVSTVRKRAFH
uniref:Uncharacterized protein n=1 Tax=Anguilla anguilla TaxID=7936 RepID=A0A0E9PVQ5_ANGAN